MIENYITSLVEGRLRLRHSVFKDVQVAAKVKEILQNVPGVEAVSHNARAGSILLEYDDECLSHETIFSLLNKGMDWQALQALADAQVTRKPLLDVSNFSLSARPMTTREKRRLFNRTMATFYGITIISLGLGSERTHILAGSVFLGLSLMHIKRMRKALL